MSNRVSFGFWEKDAVPAGPSLAVRGLGSEPALPRGTVRLVREDPAPPRRPVRAPRGSGSVGGSGREVGSVCRTPPSRKRGAGSTAAFPRRVVGVPGAPLHTLVGALRSPARRPPHPRGRLCRGARGARVVSPSAAPGPAFLRLPGGRPEFASEPRDSRGAAAGGLRGGLGAEREGSELLSSTQRLDNSRRCRRRRSSFFTIFWVFWVFQLRRYWVLRCRSGTDVCSS